MCAIECQKKHRMLRKTAIESDKFCIEGHFQMRQHVLSQYCSPTDRMTKRFQIAKITSESINENEVGLCQYHYRVSCHSISLSNINCQMSQHINVKSISMSNVKCHVSNIKCRMSNQLLLEISVVWDLRRSWEISSDLMRSQLGCIIVKVCRFKQRIDCIKIYIQYFQVRGDLQKYLRSTRH